MNCLITCWRKKRSHLFPNGILDLQQHEGVYSKMCHLGKWGIHPHPLPPCFILFLKNLNTMPTREFWSDWLIFLLFSLILTFCSDCVYRNVLSTWHQNWCKMSVWRLGFWTPGCLRKTTWSSWVTGSNTGKWKPPGLWLKWSLCKPRVFQEELERCVCPRAALDWWDWRGTSLGNQADPKRKAHAFWVYETLLVFWFP